MSIFQALILGLVQGISEFLPISSSGHLVLIPELFGWDGHTLAFDTTLHLGTALAIVVYFYKDLLGIVKHPKESQLALKIIVGSIPAGVIGYLFESAFEDYFRGVSTVALFLILGSVLMWVADKYGKRVKSDISVKESFVIGMFQSLALFPGVSRSGSTISGGLFFGLTRKDAARFSFLLSVPIVVLAGAYKLFSTATDIGLGELLTPAMLIGFLTSFISGMFVIGFLLKFLEKKGLGVFVVYRVILACVLLTIL